MNFSWASIKETVLNTWNRLSRPQRIVTVVAPLAVVVALIGLITWANQTQYVVLFSKLEPADAGTITTKLKDLKRDYKLADSGSTIMVPEQTASEIRLELANAGLPNQSKFSFDYLNTMHLGETDSDRKVRYLLALQNELETTLKMMSGVENARVHIVKPEASLFAENQQPTTAAVSLTLVQGKTLEEDQVRAMANLLTGSIEGLQMENITITDTNGNYLSDVLGENSGGTSQKLLATQYQLQRDHEEKTRRLVQSMLDQVFGEGKTVARINATLDFDEVKVTRQYHGPGALVSDQSTSSITTDKIQGDGIPGVTTNGIPSYLTPADDATYYSGETSVTRNFEVDTTQEESTLSPGRLKRLTASVLADSAVVTDEQLNLIRSVVAATAGIDPSRGDEIQVAAVPFDKTAENEAAAAKARAERRQNLINVLIAILITVIVIGALAYVLARWRQKRRAEKLAMEEARLAELSAAELLDQLTEEEAQAHLAEQMALSEEEQHKQKIRDSIEAYSHNNPEEVARLLKGWLVEES